jgi:ketosteroid isomerase-like protein
MTDSPNVQLVRSIFAAWERGDFSRIDWADPDIEFAWPEGLDASSARRGRRALAEDWRITMAAWDNLSVTAEEYRELDDELIIVLHRFRARGKMSGLQIDEGLTKGAVLFAVHRGSVRRLVVYLRRDSALADLGLEH